MKALNGLSFGIRPGERVALLGQSGAGKTTLFRLLNATLRPTSGSLRFDGLDVSALSGRELRAMRRRIGTVFQQHHLVPALTALENTLCGGLGRWSLFETLRDVIRPREREWERAMGALAAVGLADRHQSRADQLSGGQQQRLAIARVLMQDPEVILADEPFASLDPALTETIAALLIGLGEGGNRTLVVTLHDVELALRYFPRIIALRAGRVVFDQAPERVSVQALKALYADDATQPETELNERGDRIRESHRQRSCAR